uniref:Protein E6 n=1 Tax=Human papillomavirus TaxID=10566 RepID=A0A385PL25_9PAPI|nr:MAG: E6 protein [Human papillomavirus]
MANGRPRSLEEYCRRYDISFFHLSVPCIFCFHHINLQELAAFYLKQLSLVWRADQCFACCEACLKLSAKFERENYFQCAARTSVLEGLLKQDLKSIIIRCMYCCRLLDTIEKYDSLYRDDLLCLIRGKWRGTCRLCTIKQ